jgi:hypothetical protein
MPFDLVAWFESAAKNGLTAVTGVTDTRYSTSGDTQKIRAISSPFLSAMWHGSVTAAVAEQFEIRSDIMPINPNCPVGQVTDSVPILMCGVPLKAQDTLTGYHDNSNTNEISGGVAAISYGNAGAIYTPAPVKPVVAAIGLSSTTDTAGTLPAGWVTASTTWTGLETDRRYEIVGFGGWGVLDVAVRFASTTELAAGFKPGVPLGNTEAYARMTYLAEPYPFLGSNPPALEVQSIGASAEHHFVALLA